MPFYVHFVKESGYILKRITQLKAFSRYDYHWYDLVLIFIRLMILWLSLFIFLLGWTKTRLGYFWDQRQGGWTNAKVSALDIIELGEQFF